MPVVRGGGGGESREHTCMSQCELPVDQGNAHLVRTCVHGMHRTFVSRTVSAAVADSRSGSLKFPSRPPFCGPEKHLPQQLKHLTSFSAPARGSRWFWLPNFARTAEVLDVRSQNPCTPFEAEHSISFVETSGGPLQVCGGHPAYKNESWDETGPVTPMDLDS